MIIDIEVGPELLPWMWTPIMSGVSLAPGSTLSVALQAESPCPNAFVLFLSLQQFRESILPLLQQRLAIGARSYLPCAWRASLAGLVNSSHRTLGFGGHDPHFGARNAGLQTTYALGVLQATPGALHGRLVGEISFVSPNGSHLPLHEQGTAAAATLLVWAFLASAALFLGLAVLRRKSRTKLHWLMLLALALKCYGLWLLRCDMEITGKTGRQSLSRTVAWQLLKQLHQTLAIMVFFLVGVGWKVMRAQLRPSEWAFTALVSSVSLLLGVLELTCASFGGCNPQRYMLTKFTVHSLCFLVIIIATNFNIFMLQRHIAEARAAPEVSALYSKLQAFHCFRFFFVYFTLIPTVISTLALQYLSFQALWVTKEASEWIVYTAIAWLFRPGHAKLPVFDLAVIESSDSESEMTLQQ